MKHLISLSLILGLGQLAPHATRAQDDFDPANDPGFAPPAPEGVYEAPMLEADAAMDPAMTSGYNPNAPTDTDDVPSGRVRRPFRRAMTPFSGGGAPTMKRATPSGASEKTFASDDVEGGSYTRRRPAWGVEIAAGTTRGGSLPSAGSIAGNENASMHQLSMQLEYQPRFIQSAGVLGFGAAANVHLLTPRSLGSGTLAVHSVGAQARYQLRYFHRQPLVPVVGYGAEYWRYTLSSGGSGSFLAQGPLVGGWLLLNLLDSGTASDFYISSGVLRTYLVAEMRLLSGGDGVVNASGKAYFFGLRFEI